MYKYNKLSQDYIKNRLKLYFNETVPIGGVETDYEMLISAETGLVSASPAIAGNEKFYAWVASKSSYYPNERWEYAYVLKEVGCQEKRPRVVDVGCGDGKFLLRAKLERNAQVFGMDTLPEAVRLCQSKGIDARCDLLEDALRADKNLVASFDIVTSFHCLEHVPNPTSFLQGLLALLAPGGVVCVSTPLSPMPFEHAWFDPQNHPPHHLTRWSIAAYRTMAAQLGLKVEFVTPCNGSTLAWIWRTYRLRITNSPTIRPGLRHIFRIGVETLLLPITATRVIAGQRKAEVPGCDTVLALFSKS